MNELKPCANCGSADIKVIDFFNYASKQYPDGLSWIRCNKCRRQYGVPGKYTEVEDND